MGHWEYVVWAVNGLIGLGTWRNVPLAVVRLVGGLTRDSQRSKQCAEMLRLSRKDAKEIPSYFLDSPESSSPSGPARHVDNGSGNSTATASKQYPTGTRDAANLCWQVAPGLCCHFACASSRHRFRYSCSVRVDL